MSWKKSTPYFIFQSLRYSTDWAHFRKIWRMRKRWVSALLPGRASVPDEQAWLNFAAIDYLHHFLKPEHRVFEFGGGGSTLFFLKRTTEVATVENDEQWFEVLSKKVREKGYEGWRGFLVKGEPLTEDKPSGNPANPADFATKAPGQERTQYERYAKTIHQFPEQYFDVILVDGRSRPACIQEALPHLKIDGLLVVDNMEREYYWTAFKEVFEQKFETLLSGRFPTPYHPDFTWTAIFRKVS